MTGIFDKDGTLIAYNKEEISPEHLEPYLKLGYTTGEITKAQLNAIVIDEIVDNETDPLTGYAESETDLLGGCAECQTLKI